GEPGRGRLAGAGELLALRGGMAGQGQLRRPPRRPDERRRLHRLHPVLTAPGAVARRPPRACRAPSRGRHPPPVARLSQGHHSMTASSAHAHDSFVRRHVGTDPDAQRHMLEVLGYESLDDLLTAAVPSTILLDAAAEGPGSLESVVPAGISEPAALAELQT